MTDPNETTAAAPETTPTTPAGPPAGTTLDDVKPEDLKWTDPTPVTEPEPESTTEETPEGEDAPEEVAANPDAPKVFAVDLPLPEAEGKRAGILNLELPTQEAADTLRHHLKRSVQFDRVAQQAKQYEQADAIIQYLDTHPTDGMLLLSDQMPDKGESFVKSWAQQHPIEAAQIAADLGFDVAQPDDLRVEAMKAKAEAAMFKARDAVQAGRQQFEATHAQRAFAATAEGFIVDLKRELGVTSDDRWGQRFDREMADLMVQVYRQNPRAGTAEMAKHPDVQALIQDYTAQRQQAQQRQTVKAKQAASQPRVEAGVEEGGQFTKVRVDTLRKLKGGTTNPPALVPDKIAQGTTWYDLVGK